MELTNFSFLSSRIDFQVANAARVKSATKLSTGSRMDSLKEDLGSIGVSSRLQSTQLQNFAKKTNLQNFHTFLRSQSEGIDQAREIYRRMNQLAIKVLDPTTGNAGFGNSDAQSLNKEFKELSGNLAAIVNSKVNGQRLFGGRNVDFTDAISDVDKSDGNKTPILPRVTTVDVGTTSGSLEINFSTGRAPDQIYLFRGSLPNDLEPFFKPEKYYKMDSFNTGTGTYGPYTPTDTRKTSMIELQGKLDDHFKTHGLFTTGAWATPGSAQKINPDLPTNHAKRNYDTFEVTFNDCKTEVKATFDPGNDTTAAGSRGNNTNQHRESVNYGLDLMNDLSGSTKGKFMTGNPDLSNIDNDTSLTLVGLNYNSASAALTNVNDAIYEIKARFNPTLPTNDMIIPMSGSVLPGLSFGLLGCSDISTKDNARKVITSVMSEMQNLNDSVGTISAHQSRCEKQIEQLSSSEISYAAASSRVRDTDFAKQASSLARSTIKSEIANQMISKSLRLKDVLIPLTTNHHRGAMLSATL